MKEELDEDDTTDIIVNNLKHKSRKAKLQVLNGKTGVSVNGTMDSGASVTVAGLAKHGFVAKTLKDLKDKKRVKLPDGTTHSVTKSGFVRVRAVYNDEKKLVLCTHASFFCRLAKLELVFNWFYRA